MIMKWQDSLTMKDQNVYSIVKRKRNYTVNLRCIIISVKVSSKRESVFPREQENS